MNKDKAKLSILFFIMIPFGLVATFAINNLLKGGRWPSVLGIIVKSEVRQVYKSNKYYPSIVYEFEMNGASYRSPIYELEFKKGEKNETQSIVDSYSVGKGIIVYYNPDNFYESTVRVQVGSSLVYHIFRSIMHSTRVLIMYLRGVAISTLLLWIILWSLRKYSKIRPSLYICLIGAITAVASAFLSRMIYNSNLLYSMILSAFISALVLYIVLVRFAEISRKYSLLVAVAYTLIMEVGSIILVVISYTLLSIRGIP